MAYDVRIIEDKSLAGATRPLIVNYTIQASNTWEKAATAPDNCKKYTIRMRDPSKTIRWAYSSNPTTYNTLNPGYVWSDDSNPGEIWVYGTAGDVVEIEFWS